MENRLARLQVYLDTMARRLAESHHSPEKKAWIQLEIKRTKQSLERLQLEGKK